MDTSSSHHLQFNEPWQKVTVLDPLVAVLVILMALFLLFCPRKYSVWPFIVVACFVVPFQRLVVGGLDFSMMRILTIVGLIRLALHNEFKLDWKPLDTAVSIFVFAQTFVVLFNDPSGLLRNFGAAMDTLGIYLLFRCLVRNWDDVFYAVRGFVWVGIPVAGFFVVEAITHKNVFAVQAQAYFSEDVAERSGRFRCHGAFSHPILAGCFWATMMPLMTVMLWRGARARMEAVVGLTVSSIIVIACASSTPVASVMFGVIAGSMFFLRYGLAWIRWAVAATLLGVQILWDKPVWRLMAKADILSGSTGFYRYQLVDATVKHFSEWAMIGTVVKTETWIPGLKDVTNYYIMFGLQGGVGLIVLFLILLAVGFSTASRIWCRAEREHHRVEAYAGWAMGVTLFCHAMNFLSVTYFGQILMVWALHLAIISSLTPSRWRRRLVRRHIIVEESQQSAPSTPPRAAQVPTYSGSAL